MYTIVGAVASHCRRSIQSDTAAPTHPPPLVHTLQPTAQDQAGIYRACVVCIPVLVLFKPYEGAAQACKCSVVTSLNMHH